MKSKTPTIEHYQDGKLQHRWKLKHGNGKILAASSKRNLKAVQKALAALTLGLMLFGVLTISGCTTTQNPSGIITVGGVTIDPVKTGHIVQVLAKNGGVAAIQQKPSVRPYFKDASLAITLAIAAGTVAPDDIKASLSGVTSDPLAVSAVTDALQIYGDFYGDVVTAKLADKSPYAIPVLLGLATGLRQAYDLTAPAP